MCDGRKCYVNCAYDSTSNSVIFKLISRLHSLHARTLTLLIVAYLIRRSVCHYSDIAILPINSSPTGDVRCHIAARNLVPFACLHVNHFDMSALFNVKIAPCPRYRLNIQLFAVRIEYE